MEARKIFTVSDLMAAIADNTTRHEVVEGAEGMWATSSGFYNQVMEDGHIFNPYLHRRFVPSQFLRLMKYYGMDARAGIERSYGYAYSIEWVKEEVRKLAFLQKADPIAFDERQHFLTLDDVKSIIGDYVADATQLINDHMAFWYAIRSGKHRIIRARDEKEALICELHKFNDRVQCVITYDTMSELLQDLYVININYDRAKSHTFIESFTRGGAYYTLKHLVLFEHLSLNGKIGAEACAELTKYLNVPADAICGILKITMTENKYTL